MSQLVCSYRVNWLADWQKLELNYQFDEPGRDAMPHQIAVMLGISYSDALGLLIELEDNHLCEMKLLIYHSCEPDVPIASMPYGQGFPQLPWLCPNCDNEVDNMKDLRFDFMAKAFQSIQFI